MYQMTQSYTLMTDLLTPPVVLLHCALPKVWTANMDERGGTIGGFVHDFTVGVPYARIRQVVDVRMACRNGHNACVWLAESTKRRDVRACARTPVDEPIPLRNAGQHRRRQHRQLGARSKGGWSDPNEQFVVDYTVNSPRCAASS
jgi:hypothetical protein